MLVVVWAVSLALTAWFALLLGRRLERGKLEIDLATREEVAAKRAGRPGTVHLTTMRIRR